MNFACAIQQQGMQRARENQVCCCHPSISSSVVGATHQRVPLALCVPTVMSKLSAVSLGSLMFRSLFPADLTSTAPRSDARRRAAFSRAHNHQRYCPPPNVPSACHAGSGVTGLTGSAHSILEHRDLGIQGQRTGLQSRVRAARHAVQVLDSGCPET